MSRQKEYTKTDLSFEELLKAGLNTPPQPAKPSKRQPKKPTGKAKRKQVKSGA